MAEGILLRFANEEVIYLLRSLNIPDFPGIALDPLKALNDEQKSLLMMEADHTLRARGLVHWRGETQREIAPLIRKMFQDCAQPRYTLFVDMRDAHTPARQWLYIIGSEMYVEQCEPEPQVQQYLVIPSQEEFSQRLQRLVIPQQEEQSDADTLPPGQISLDRWREALRVDSEDEAGASTLLTGSLPAQTAEALAASLHDFQQVRYLACWQQTPTPERSSPDAALTLVAGPERLFLLWQEEADHSLLSVMPSSAQQVRDYLNRLIVPQM